MTSPAKIINQNLPTVALVGRVNVGKSSLFNKIIEQNLALVSNIPGTTRTNNAAVATWRGKNFQLVDTGGLTFSDEVPLEDDIIKQTELALKEAQRRGLISYTPGSSSFTIEKDVTEQQNLSLLPVLI